MRAAYPIQQRQQKGWKAMFYAMIGIVVVNSYLLSSYAPVSRKEKFAKHLAFREALFKQLFEHATGVEVAIGAANVLPVAGPINAILPPGDTVPANELNAESGVATMAVAKTAHTVGQILAKTAVTSKIEHQRISMKRAACVICKQAPKQEKKATARQKRSPLQAVTLNTMNQEKNRHIPRSITGCASCNVSLCAKKGCWEAFHSSC